MIPCGNMIYNLSRKIVLSGKLDALYKKNIVLLLPVRLIGASERIAPLIIIIQTLFYNRNALYLREKLQNKIGVLGNNLFFGFKFQV